MITLFIFTAWNAAGIIITILAITYIGIGSLVALAMRGSGESTEPFIYLATRWPKYLKSEETEDTFL